MRFPSRSPGRAASDDGGSLVPRGAAVLDYRGKRGRVRRIKYSDADGKQMMETLGPEREGWNRRKAEAELASGS